MIGHEFRAERRRRLMLAATIAAAVTATATAAIAPSPALAGAKCGSRYPNQVAAGYPAGVSASGVSCHTARIVAATCSTVSAARCHSQGRTWRQLHRVLRVNGQPVGWRVTCTSGSAIVAYTVYGDD